MSGERADRGDLRAAGEPVEPRELSRGATAALRRLREASASLLEIDDLQTLYDAIVQRAAELLGCEAAILWLVDAPGRYLYRAAATGLRGRTDGYVRLLPLEDTLEGKVLATGERATGLLIESRAAGYRPLLGAGLRTGLSSPLHRDGRSPLGVLSFLHAAGERFRPWDEELAGAFAAAAGSTLLDLNRREEQRRVATLLRRARLPSAVPATLDLELAVEVGADATPNERGRMFYDVLEIEGCHAIAYGELSGIGSSEEGFALMASARLRECARADPSPASVAERLNRIMCETFGHELLLALVYELFDPAFKTLTLVNAGSWPPVLLRSGSAEPVKTGGAILGAYADEGYAPFELSLRAGDAVVGYTSGIPEAWSGKGSPRMDFVRDALERHAHDDAPSLVENLMAEASKARGGHAPPGSIAVALRFATE